MRIKEIKFKNFCGFKTFSMPLGLFSVLIGPNNGGKTTILKGIFYAWKFFRFAWAESKPQLQQLRQNWPTFSRNLNSELESVNSNPSITAKAQAQQKAHQKYAKNLDSMLLNIRVLNCDLNKACTSLALPSIETLFFGHTKEEDFEIYLAIEIDKKEYKIEITGSSRGKLKVSVLDETGLFAMEPKSVETLDEFERFWDSIVRVEIEFLPPVITLLPKELSMSWPEIEKRISEGKEFEIWRNRIHWLTEGRDPEILKRVIARVRQSLDDVIFQSPGRTKDSKPEVRIAYKESGREYDISESGSGLRSLFAISAYLELSNSSILLFDEPDTHLHSLVQRQVADFMVQSASNEKQIIITTHAPDMIEEFPLECLHFIERKNEMPSSADSTASALVQLGAISHGQAMRIINAKALMYFEDKPDEKILASLMRACGVESLFSQCAIAKLNGAGDAVHLPVVARFLEQHHSKRVPMVALLDGDFSDDLGVPTIDGVVMIAKLPCKELENLLLLQPEALFARVNEAAKEKESRTGVAPEVPSISEIHDIIERCTLEDDVSTQVRLNWISRHLPQNRKTDAGELGRIETQFNTLWSDALYRRKCCPGKKVLRLVKCHIQEKSGLSFSDASAFAHYKTPQELKDLFIQMDRHVSESLR